MKRNKIKYYFERPNYEFGIFLGVVGYGLGYIISNLIISNYLTMTLQIYQVNAIYNTSFINGIIFFVVFFLIGSLIEYKKIELIKKEVKSK